MKSQQKIIAGLLVAMLLTPVYSQKKGLSTINRQDLEMHMEFLASDELQGRSTGEPGLDIAARYLAIQAKRLGLQSADSQNGYFQYYSIEEKEYDRDKCNISIRNSLGETVINKDPFYLLPPSPEPSTIIEGEVVYAGYGISDEAHNYNDFENIDITDKIVLIMNRAPMNEAGTEALFDNEKWGGMQNFQYKIQYMMQFQPRAILIVFDPKSGFNSIDEQIPEIAEYLSKSKSLKSDVKEEPRGSMGPKIVLVHRSVADQLLLPSGKNLVDLQKETDKTLESHSFLIENTTLKVELHIKEKESVVPNVFGFIEGSDPALKNEMVIYSAHFDHVGTDGKGGVYNGADDNASGTVALIEIAEAFLKEKKASKRSVGFLWVSGEEIGLFGSEYFSEHPLVSLESISAVINLDMISRRQTEEDIQSKRDGLTIGGGDTVKVIGGIQSKVLMDLNKQALSEMNLPGNYRFNDLDHPLRFFYRSDHINFARKDIPIIFYSTGTHADYHLVSDIEEKVDYDRFIQMSKLSYLLGYKTANYSGPIVVDNPMSTWK